MKSILQGKTLQANLKKIRSHNLDLTVLESDAILSKLSSINTEWREFLDSVLNGYNIKEKSSGGLSIRPKVKQELWAI